MDRMGYLLLEDEHAIIFLHPNGDIIPQHRNGYMDICGASFDGFKLLKNNNKKINGYIFQNCMLDINGTRIVKVIEEVKDEFKRSLEIDKNTYDNYLLQLSAEIIMGNYTYPNEVLRFDFKDNYLMITPYNGIIYQVKFNQLVLDCILNRYKEQNYESNDKIN